MAGPVTALEEAVEEARGCAGQLEACARAAAAATGRPVVETWIHLPVSGVAVWVEGWGGVSPSARKQASTRAQHGRSGRSSWPT